MNLQDFRQLSAGHALHALSPEEELVFAHALEAHPEWQGIVDEDLETTAELGDASPNATPDVRVRANLLALIDSLPQEAADETPAAETGASSAGSAEPSSTSSASRTSPNDHRSSAGRGRRRTLWAGAFALAASVAVLAAVTLGPRLFGPGQNPAEVALVEVSAAGDAQEQTVQVVGGGSATLHWSDELDRAVLVTEQLPTLAEDQDLEVWLVRGDTPISAGVLAPDEEPAVLDDFLPGDVIALTVEAAGGSPTGAPTTEPIAAITTA